MRRFHIAVVLLMSAVLMTGLASTVSADSFQFSGNCRYNGDKITSSFTSEEFAASQAQLEPGDDLAYTVKYKNESDETTLWYMRNSVLETLEEAKDQAENGGYTYTLANVDPKGKETILFDNSEVGGETKTADLEGLKQATNATGNFFFIQELKPGETATTKLYVALDGETEVNDYMDTYGALMVSYAVENQATGTNTEQPGTSTPRTGDQTDLMKWILMMAGALVLALLAIISWRRDRREDEPAMATAGAGASAVVTGAEAGMAEHAADAVGVASTTAGSKTTAAGPGKSTNPDLDAALDLAERRKDGDRA